MHYEKVPLWSGSTVCELWRMQERARVREMGTEVAFFWPTEREWKGGNERETRVRDEDGETRVRETGGERQRDRERERERGTQSERWGTVPQRGSGKSKRCPERSRWRPYLGVLGWTAGRGYLQATVRSLDREVEGIILGYHGGCRPCPLGCHRWSDKTTKLPDERGSQLHGAGGGGGGSSSGGYTQTDSRLL